MNIIHCDFNSFIYSIRSIRISKKQAILAGGVVLAVGLAALAYQKLLPSESKAKLEGAINSLKTSVCQKSKSFLSSISTKAKHFFTRGKGHQGTTGSATPIASELIFVARKGESTQLIESMLPQGVGARQLTREEFRDKASELEGRSETLPPQKIFLVYDWNGLHACVVFRQPEGRFKNYRDVAQRIFDANKPNQEIHLVVVRSFNYLGPTMSTEEFKQSLINTQTELKPWAERGRFHVYDCARTRNPYKLLFHPFVGVQQQDAFHQLLYT